MEEYKERMKQEFIELDTRVARLMDFFYHHKDKELELEQDEIVDMRCQLYAMQAYRNTLGRRCIRQGIDIPNAELYMYDANKG